LESRSNNAPPSVVFGLIQELECRFEALYIMNATWVIYPFFGCNLKLISKYFNTTFDFESTLLLWETYWLETSFHLALA
jgi:hypothetical protein